MKLARDQEPPKAKAGDKVRFKHRDHEWEEEVQPSCDINAPNSGHWYCATHMTGVHHLQDRDHWTTECRAVWICHTHGPEVP